MAQKFILFQSPPMRNPIADSRRGFLVTSEWEWWFHRLLAGIFNRQSCHVFFAANKSISHNTQTDVLFDDEEHDNASFHSVSAATDQIVIPEDGIYRFGCHVIFAANATGVRTLVISLNDAAPSTVYLDGDQRDGSSTVAGYLKAGGSRSLVAGDVLRAAVTQTSGAPLNLFGVTTLGPYANGFWCHKVSGV